MSRALLSQTVIDRNGNAQPGVTVHVYEPGTTTPIAATMHDALTGGSVLTNPLTTDVNGGIVAFLDAAQDVTLRVVEGSVERTVPAVAGGSGGGGSLPSWWTVDSTPGSESVDFGGAVTISGVDEDSTLLTLPLIGNAGLSASGRGIHFTATGDAVEQGLSHFEATDDDGQIIWLLEADGNMLVKMSQSARFSGSGVGFQIIDSLGGGMSIKAGRTLIETKAGGEFIVRAANGDDSISLDANTGAIGFFNHARAAQAVHPVTLGDVITILTNLGLCA